MGRVDQLHHMSRFFRPLAEGLRQHSRGALAVGTVQQQNDFHLRSSFHIFWFPVDHTWLPLAAAAVFWAMTHTREWGV